MNTPYLRDQENHPDDDLKYYLNQIGEYSLLSAEDEVVHSRKVQEMVRARERLATGVTAKEAGDLHIVVSEGQRAWDVLFHSNLRLVVYLAKKEWLPGLTLLDLIQEGNLGLMKSIEMYDPERGVRFASYASYWVRQMMKRFKDMYRGEYRLPAYIYPELLRLFHLQYKYVGEFGKEAPHEWLKEQLGATEELYQSLLRLQTSAISIDNPPRFYQGEEDGHIDVVHEGQTPIDEELDQKEMIAVVAALLQHVKRDRDREVLKLHFGLDDNRYKTYQETGDLIGLTKQRAKQIVDRALADIHLHLELDPATMEALKEWS